MLTFSVPINSYTTSSIFLKDAFSSIFPVQGMHLFTLTLLFEMRSDSFFLFVWHFNSWPQYMRDVETLAEISELSFSACRCFTAFLFPGPHIFSLIIFSWVILSPLVCLLLIWSLVFIPLSDNFFGPVSCMRVMPFLSASVEALMGSKGGRLAFCRRLISKLVRQGHCQRLCWWSKGTGNYSRSRAATSPAGERECVCVLRIVCELLQFSVLLFVVCVCVCVCVCVLVCAFNMPDTQLCSIPLWKPCRNRARRPLSP